MPNQPKFLHHQRKIGGARPYSSYMRIAFACLLIATSLYAAEPEVKDYNFDCHDDYRVYRESNGKLHYYDIYLFDQSTGRYVLHDQLSHLYNPEPDADSKEIRCLFPGGHSGALFGRIDYRWEDNQLVYVRSVAQTNVDFKDGKVHYIRVTMILRDGAPGIESIEAVTPFE